MSNQIHPSFMCGKGFEIGYFNIIHEAVIVGHNVTIRSLVELRPHTRIGNNCYIDSGVKMSGHCDIGNNVTIRYDAIIARGVTVGDNTYICPQVMTENLNHKREAIGGAKIGCRCFIGTNVTLAAGITVCDDVIIGSKANVRKSITEPGIYVGNPARKIK